MRYACVPYVTGDGVLLSVTYFTPKFTVTKRRGTVFVHRFQLMKLETFQAVKFGGSKGGPGASAASWGGSGVPGVGGR